MRSHSDVMFAFIEAMSEDGQIDLTVQGPGGLPRQLTIEVADPAARRDMTEPPALMPGLGMRFWAPPTPAVIGVVQPGGPADAAGLLAGDRIVAVDGQAIADFPAVVDAVAAAAVAVVVGVVDEGDAVVVVAVVIAAVSVAVVGVCDAAGAAAVAVVVDVADADVAPAEAGDTVLVPGARRG